MARSLRCEFQDGWYHVTARGNERKDIFRNDSDREHFLEILAELEGRVGLELHGYVLMGNHHHLLLRLRGEPGGHFDPAGGLQKSTPSAFPPNTKTRKLAGSTSDTAITPPTTSRWASLDPIGKAGRINVRTFVGNNPVHFVDPFWLAYAPDPGVWILTTEEENVDGAPVSSRHGRGDTA